eukprot:TRINITY_DN1956_c0_g2_i1.p1 TRINITY_DN1956_c0_g2~~TRINITY_DN1956_c0_g2_i1.p1  ORF type:complete len:117 (-),score=38.91 TRINITY_DN1956_c0_g2_i1:114-464(-)
MAFVEIVGRVCYGLFAEVLWTAIGIGSGVSGFCLALANHSFGDCGGYGMGVLMLLVGGISGVISATVAAASLVLIETIMIDRIKLCGATCVLIFIFNFVFACSIANNHNKRRYINK